MSETLLQSIIAQGFSGLLPALIGMFIRRSPRNARVTEQVIQTDFREHLNNTFQRCATIKTIINEAPVSTLAIYVPLTFKKNDALIDQYDVVDQIREGDSVIIQGTAGGGKSMFMRYLWISLFVNSNGRITLFIELRNTSAFTHQKFLDYVYHHVLQARASIALGEFYRRASNGDFVLFLDGFDEIAINRRAEIEKHILNMRANYPKMPIVVTSRPDGRFAGWHQFSSMHVQPLNREQATRLIEIADFDSHAKNKLIARIKSGLFGTHQSFLSNPLLAYMMLLTINRNPDIPRRMHLFYEQAFDALFHRHDTTKGAFRRTFHTSLDKSAFMRQLSYLSLITYLENVLEMNEEVLVGYATKALKLGEADEAPLAFVKDLVESVCILKVDGLDFSFVH